MWLLVCYVMLLLLLLCVWFLRDQYEPADLIDDHSTLPFDLTFEGMERTAQ